MKIIKIVAVITLVLFTSCAKDKNDDNIQFLVGHWHVFDFQADPDSPIDDSLLAKEAIMKLNVVGCDPIEYTFGSDGEFFAKDGLRYVSVAAGEAGVEFGCPSQFDFGTGSFDFNNERLTLNYDEGNLELEGSMDGENLMINVNNMVINGKQVSGKLLFMRQIN